MLLPIQHPYHCNENQAEEVLSQLLQTGKIRQIEHDKYEPTEKVSTIGGD
jgi:hypothetical protein